jgi:phage shock protein A
MSREDEIKADIAKAEHKQEEALKAGDRALAMQIQQQILVLLEDLKNERQRLENERQHQRQLELASASMPSVVASSSQALSGRNSILNIYSYIDFIR